MDNKSMSFLGFLTSLKGNEYEAFCYLNGDKFGYVMSDKGAIKLRCFNYYSKKAQRYIYDFEVEDRTGNDTELFEMSNQKGANISLLVHIAQGYTEKTPRKKIGDKEKKPIRPATWEEAFGK